MIEILTTEKVWVENLARALIGPTTDVDDVVHDTWMAALVRPPHDRDHSRGWLRSVVRNIVGRRRYAAMRRRIVENRAGKREAIDGGQSAVETLELHDILIRAVQSLPATQRDIVVLSYFRGETSAEIARRLAMPAATVRSHLARALAELRDLLDQKFDGDRSAWCWAMAPLAMGSSATASAAGHSVSFGVGRPFIEIGGAAVSKKSAFALLAVMVVAAVIGATYVFVTGDDDSRMDVDVANATEVRHEEPATPRRATKTAENSVESTPERDSSAESSPVAACTIRIEDAEGRALPRTGVILARGPYVLEKTTTDAEGIILCRAEPGAAEAIVVLAKYAVFRKSLEIAPGRTSVRLPAMSPVSGKVIVDGQVPTEPLRFELTARDRIFPNHSNAVVAAVAELIAKAPASQATTTSDGGKFAFTGVDEDFTGSITLPLGYGKDDIVLYSRRIPLTKPSSDVLLDISALPVIAGRAVSGEKKRPVPGATIHIEYGAAEGGTQLVLGETTTDERGEFKDVVLSRTAPSLTLRAEKGGATVSATVRGPIKGLVRADDILFDELRTVRFSIAGTDKLPIADAIVETTKGSTRSSPADASGIATIENVASTEFDVEVRAAKYAVAKVTVPPRVDDLVSVTLEKTNRLIIVVEDTDGRPLAGRYVRLTAEKPPLVRHTNNEIGGVPPIGTHIIETGNFDRKMNARYFTTDSRGRIEIESVAPTVRIDAAVVDRLRRVVGRPETVQIDEFEERTIEIVLSAPAPRNVAGIVTDENGVAVPSAHVTIHEPENGLYNLLDTAVDGKFTLQGVDFDACDIMVSTSDKRSVRIRNCAMPKPGEMLELRLKPKRTDRFSIEVVDEGGINVDGELSAVYDGGIYGAVKRDDVGRYSVGLDFGEPVEIVARVGGRQFKVHVAAGETSKKITVPATGTLVVKWRKDLDSARTYRVAVKAGEGHAPLTTALDADHIAKRSVAVLGAFAGRAVVTIEVQSDADSWNWSPVGEPLSVMVEAGKETTADL